MYVTEANVDQALAVSRAVSLTENNQATLTIVEVVAPGRENVQSVAKHMRALESLIAPYRLRLCCIMAAVDFDPLKPSAAEQALNLEMLELAGSLVLSEAASLHLVHAWEAFAERAMLARDD
ncbi:MAG: hypothetical protein CVU57_02520 [Deltaproteobacteria bacterium HGW-Deltaproteobacteria-15]|jgi:hypothetical protein|nr:MAG: hypothetical protein CVU57_02520 [Deltaproteobacteria bacterium HGW-Deltaproteobacteria-15]